MIKLVLLSIMVLVPMISSAECRYNGEDYPEGTVIGGYICEEDGTWRDQDSE